MVQLQCSPPCERQSNSLVWNAEGCSVVGQAAGKLCMKASINAPNGSSMQYMLALEHLNETFIQILLTSA